MGDPGTEPPSTASDADREFFAALRGADARALEKLLVDDFVLVDVLMGSEVPRTVLLEALETGKISFDVIDVLDSRVRRYGDAAVVIGRTEMRGVAGGKPWSARSRYTHVYVAQGGRWRLASAQGTPIADGVAT
jgi:ketosteroid isomerase-like protein